MCVKRNWGIWMGAATQECDEQFPTENNSSESIAVGKLLKSARQGKKLTISDIATQTHIRQLYLTAMEEGNFDALPGEIYKIGFIKTYATFLELDGQELLRRLNLNQEVELSYIDNKHVVPTEQQQQPNKKFLYLSLAGALIFTVGLYMLNNSSHTFVPPVSLPETPTSERKVTTDTNGETLTQSTSGVAQKSDEEPMAVESDETSAAVQSSPEASADATKNKLTSTNSPTVNSAGTEIILTAVKDAWVQVLDSSEKTIYVRLMHSGDTYKLPEEGTFKLNTGNAGGLKIVINGKDSKVLGNEGEVLRGIDLTENGLKSYF